MIGKNELKLNEAEMSKAVEYYLNHVLFKQDIVVESVVQDRATNIFYIVLGEKESDKPE